MSAAVLAPEVSDAAGSASRRRSGRVSKKPEKFTPAPNPAGNAKRKRGNDNDSGVDADEVSSEEDAEESSEDEQDEEEVRGQQRKKRGRPAARKPATKKPKTNGESVSLAIRPATTTAKAGTKRPRKAPLRKSTLPEETEGLYGRQLQQCRFLCR